MELFMKLRITNLDIDATQSLDKKLLRPSSTTRSMSVRPTKSVKRIKSLRPKRTLLSARKRNLTANDSFGEL